MGVFQPEIIEAPKRFDITSFLTSIISRQEDPWTGAEAFLCIVTSAASCDGTISPEESEEILSMIHRARLFKNASGDELRKVNSAVADRLAKRGGRALAEACAALPDEFKLAAFAYSVDIVMADGGLVRAEADFLNQLTSLLGVPDDQARRIAEVMNIKNSC